MCPVNATPTVMPPDERDTPKTVDQWAFCLRGLIEGELHPAKIAQALLTLGHPDHMTMAIINAVYGYGALDLTAVPQTVAETYYEFLSSQTYHDASRVSYARIHYAKTALDAARAMEKRKASRRKQQRTSRRKNRRRKRRR